MLHNTTVRQNNGWQNGLISQMLFSEFYKIMVNKVAFVGLGGAIAPSPPSGSAPAGRAEATIKHMASVPRYVVFSDTALYGQLPSDKQPWVFSARLCFVDAK